MVGLNPATPVLEVIVSKLAPRYRERMIKTRVSYQVVIFSILVEPAAVDHNCMSSLRWPFDLNANGISPVQLLHGLSKFGKSTISRIVATHDPKPRQHRILSVPRLFGHPWRRKAKCSSDDLVLRNIVLAVVVLRNARSRCRPAPVAPFLRLHLEGQVQLVWISDALWKSIEAADPIEHGADEPESLTHFSRTHRAGGQLPARRPDPESRHRSP